MRVLNDILHTASTKPDTTAVVQLGTTDCGELNIRMSISYAELVHKLALLSEIISAEVTAGAYIGVVMENSAEWIITDLALLFGKFVEVPVPLVFSSEQAFHLLQSCVLVLVDEIGLVQLNAWRTASEKPFPKHLIVSLSRLSNGTAPNVEQAKEYEDWICKVIHTSGTTSQPKGVMTRVRALDVMLESLWRFAEKTDYQCYLSLVPFSLLIEQITALYMPYSSGGYVILPPVTMAPLGSAGVTAKDRLSLIAHAQPSALTLTPALLEALVDAARSNPNANRAELSQILFGREDPPFLAVGGAPVAPELLHEFANRGIEIFQGYGLSENTSVVAWNSRRGNRIGSVGRPLPHVEVRLSVGSELYIRSSSLFAGYSNSDPSSCHVDADGWLHTGDIAEIDNDGYITILGRKKTMIITSNGRNISPEWLESRYRTVQGVAQVVVLGDRRQFLEGLFLIEADADFETVSVAIHNFAQMYLSQLERVDNPILLRDTPEIRQDLFTVTGRPRRERVEKFVATFIK